MKPLMTEIEIDIRRQLRRVERIHGSDHYAALARWSNCQRHRLAGHVVRRIPTQLRSRVHSEGPRRRATVFRPEPVASKLKTNDDPKPTSNPLNFFCSESGGFSFSDFVRKSPQLSPNMCLRECDHPLRPINPFDTESIDGLLVYWTPTRSLKDQQYQQY